MLKYTGHPILDVGIATIVAFANRNTPTEIIPSDLESIANYMASNYIVNPLKTFLTVAFPNSGFTQPAYEKTPEKRKLYAERVLYAFRDNNPILPELDFFLGLPVTNISFNVDATLIPGRVFRQHIPLQTGEGTINFHPYGHTGLPISGLALLAFQAYPLGSAKCQGRMLSVHSDNHEIMRYFASKFLSENRKAVQLAQQTSKQDKQDSKAKMPEPHLKYRTLLIQTLLDAIQKQVKNRNQSQPFSITAYHLTNIGQGADLNIYHLPSQIIRYLQLMLGADYQPAWSQLVREGWMLPKLKRGQTTTPADFKSECNYLYEDLFHLAENVSQKTPAFIRTYFLRDTLRYARKNPTDPRGQYSTRQQAHLISWKLTEPFLRSILNMEAEQVSQIRTLGDVLAEYVAKQNDRRFFRNFYTENRYLYFRNELIKANIAHTKYGNPPFLTLDNYLNVFEFGEDLPSYHWKLARDLVLIRMVEQLYANGWLRANIDAVPDNRQEDEPELQTKQQEE